MSMNSSRSPTTALMALLSLGLLCAACGDSARFYSGKEAEALALSMEEMEYQYRSTLEHVNADPELRALIPRSAAYRPYTALRMKDTWTTDERLPQVLSWYRVEMKTREFAPTLEQCTTGSVWGGRVELINYCSATHHALVTLAEDTTNNVTVVAVMLAPRTASFRCEVPVPEEYRLKNTAGCPQELLP
jgi:hypothetical protein